MAGADLRPKFEELIDVPQTRRLYSNKNNLLASTGLAGFDRHHLLFLSPSPAAITQRGRRGSGPERVGHLSLN